MNIFEKYKQDRKKNNISAILDIPDDLGKLSPANSNPNASLWYKRLYDKIFSFNAINENIKKIIKTNKIFDIKIIFTKSVFSLFSMLW